MAASTTQESPPPAATSAVHKPYVPDKEQQHEFTLIPVLVGTLLGIIFGASSLYLVLKVGMTVSASIPVAVLSITLFRGLSRLGFVRRATILENNIVQTTGSAGESIAFGVGVTMPALMLLGFEMDIGRVMVVSVLGGLLGILMMIPLRRAFIVKKHGVLKYPEGTACADVLIVGEQGGSSAKTVFVGFGIAFIFQFVRLGFKLFQETIKTSLSWFKGAVPALETDPTLLGVGYIIGTRISCIMVAGGVLAAFVLVPAIHLFGDHLTDPLYPGTKPISQMSEGQVQHDYILYIGAGAVAAGGIISLFQALPLIFSSLLGAVRDIRGSRGRSDSDAVPRTDRDLPLWIVGVGAIGLVAAIWLTAPLHDALPWVPQLHMNPVGALLIVLFGFLFVTVSSRLTGEIGSSSNPISGMTVATLLLTCLIFLALGWTSAQDTVTALSVAAVVCIAASNGGTTSQDLKTGFLVGATPKWQQLAILVGSLSSALVIGIVLIMINNGNTVYTKKDLPLPKRPISVANVKETGQAPGDSTTYHDLRVAEGNEYGLPVGEYLLNDQGAIVYLVDPGINGSRTHRDDGTQVTKFSAPKATLMAFITGGILEQKLPWTLVLIGVCISLVLELCGIPSLAFAVGVYLPLSTSTPIFVGGAVRYIADRWARGHGTAPLSETEAEMSPGVLMSTGYIAGGAIAGVLVAFLSFGNTIPRFLGQWQYREVPTPRQESFTEACTTVAQQELGLGQGKPTSPEQKKAVQNLADGIEELNDDLRPEYVFVHKGTELRIPGGASLVVDRDGYLKDLVAKPDMAETLFDLNLDVLVPVPKGATLVLPDEAPLATNDRNYWLGSLAAGPPLQLASYLEAAPHTYAVTEERPLGEVARLALGDSEKSTRLYNLNKGKLKPQVELPAGTELKLPQGNTPALVAFGVLVVLLLLVGLDWLLYSPPGGEGPFPSGPPRDTTLGNHVTEDAGQHE